MQNRREFATAGILLAGSMAAPALAQSPASPKAIAEAFAKTLSDHDIDAFAALFADNYVNHQFSAAAPPPPAGVPAKQGSVGFFKGRLTGMPDLKVTTEVVVADETHVAASFAYTGTQTGTYLGVAPTGRTLKFTSCDIFRIENGKIAEHWGMGDIAGVMAQLRA